MGRDDEQKWLGDFYDESAEDYDVWMRYYDRWMLGRSRRRLCGLAQGRTLEVGVGTGLNLALYPSTSQVTGLDFSYRMLDVANRNRRGPEQALVRGDARRLPFKTAGFDTVLSTLFLSSVPRPEDTAAEVYRVLRPGGRVLLIDHGRSNIPPVAWLEVVTYRFVHARTGVDLRREPVKLLNAVGFRDFSVARARLGIIQTIEANRPA